jgi:hypothetical protein
MSEPKKRTIAEIQGEYQNLCTKAGHIQYQVKVLNDDLQLLNEQLKDLNLEAAKVNAESQAAAEQPKAEEASSNA